MRAPVSIRRLQAVVAWFPALSEPANIYVAGKYAMSLLLYLKLLHLREETCQNNN
jgi:hypothetical protein